MKRTSLISAVAMIAVLGSAAASFADGKKDMERRGGMMPTFEMLDADGDGLVTEAEMDAYKKAEMDARKAARFAEADTDGNGSLSAEEMSAKMPGKGEKDKKGEKGSERKTERLEKMISRMDTDGDGEVSAAEMDAMEKKSLFERLDTNGDGVLTADEFAAGADRGHGKGGHGKGKSDN